MVQQYFQYTLLLCIGCKNLNIRMLSPETKLQTISCTFGLEEATLVACDCVHFSFADFVCPFLVLPLSFNLSKLIKWHSFFQIDQSVFTVCPSKPDMRPGMILMFELFILSGPFTATDKVVAWGCFPICDGVFNVVEGKCVFLGYVTLR